MLWRVSLVSFLLILEHVYGQLPGQTSPQGTFNQPGQTPPQGTFNQPGQGTFNQPGQGTFNQPLQPPAQPQPQPGTNINFQQPPQPQPGAIPMVPQPGQSPPMGPGGPDISPAQAPGLNPELQKQQVCDQAGRAAVSQCFASNGGFQMPTVIALLSNGTQGQLPQNSQQVKASLCQKQGSVIACIFNNIKRLNGSQQCQTIRNIVKLEQETVGLLNGVQQMCGTGLMPKITPCMRRLNFELGQCYKKVGLQPELYSPRGSRMEGAVIGDNREVAKMFCEKRGELFKCQNSIIEACPNAKQLQAISGNDHVSMQKGMDVLCKDTNEYVRGLVCFQSPSEEVQKCANNLIKEMTEITMKQIQENLSADDFFREYCKVRIANLNCDGKAWGKSCTEVAVGLKSEFQCNLLPSACKNDTKIKNIYEQVCSEQNYARSLRTQGSGASSVFTTATTIATVIVTVVGLIL